MSDKGDDAVNETALTPCDASYRGIPCVKPLYRARNGEDWPHAGGHMFLTREQQQQRMHADDFDARSFLAGLRPVPKAEISAASSEESP